MTVFSVIHKPAFITLAPGEHAAHTLLFRPPAEKLPLHAGYSLPR